MIKAQGGSRGSEPIWFISLGLAGREGKESVMAVGHWQIVIYGLYGAGHWWTNLKGHVGQEEQLLSAPESWCCDCRRPSWSIITLWSASLCSMPARLACMRGVRASQVGELAAHWYESVAGCWAPCQTSTHTGVLIMSLHEYSTESLIHQSCTSWGAITLGHASHSCSL